MQAQNVNSRFAAIAAARNSASTTETSDAAARCTPQLSQQAHDRWTDLPVDVAVQVMYWTMLGTGTSRWATSFALTSKHFAQAGESFRTGFWYQDAQSALMHDRTTGWTCTYVSLLSYSLLALAPADLGELNASLEFMGKGDEGMLHSLNIEYQRHAAPATDYLGGFRNFQGTALSLMTGVLEKTRDDIVEVARALPPNVCLSVQFSRQIFGRDGDQAGVANFINRVALTGRATAFNLTGHADLSTRPEELGAVLEVACGRGMVSFFHFGRMANPDAMVQALRERCHRFRDLKLVMFGCVHPPARDSLAALAAVMEKRNAASRSRLTVVIDCAGLQCRDTQAANTLSADERAGYEGAGLLFECLDTATENDRGEYKVLASVNGWPFQGLLPQPLRVETDSWPDGEDGIDFSDSDDWPDSSDDEAHAVATPQANRADDRSVPRVVQRDRCVIS